MKYKIRTPVASKGFIYLDLLSSYCGMVLFTQQAQK